MFGYIPIFFDSALLQGWIVEDLPFLLWRQRLTDLADSWKESNSKINHLIRGLELKEAREWQRFRSGDLSEEELAFINESAGRVTKVLRKIGIGSAVALSVALFCYLLLRSDWGQYESILRHPPGIASLLAGPEKGNAIRLAVALGDEAVPRDQILHDWFLAWGRAGKSKDGLLRAALLPPPIRPIALSALARGQGDNSSPTWDAALNVADSNSTGDRLRLLALIDIERDYLDSAIAAVGSIPDVRARNEICNQIVKILVERHQNFEARRIARHFADDYYSASETSMTITDGAVVDPLVTLYTQLYLTNGGMPT